MSSSELAEIDQKMSVTDHCPVHWRISSFVSHSSTEYEVKRIDWVVLNSILNLKQNFLFSLSEQMRQDPNRISFLFTSPFSCGLTRKDVPPITWTKTLSTKLYLSIWWNLIKHRTQNSLSLSIGPRSEEHRKFYVVSETSTFIMNWKRSSELNGKSFCLGLEPKKILIAFGTIRRNFSRSERLEFKGFWMRKTIECWPKNWLPWLKHAPPILFGGFSVKNGTRPSQKPRRSEIQTASGRKISWTSVETIYVQHQRSASLHSSIENENIEWSWEGVEQTTQIDSSLALRLHPPKHSISFSSRNTYPEHWKIVQRWYCYRKKNQRFSMWIKHDQFLFCLALVKSTNGASSSIFANGWKTMLFFHQNNRVFARTTQPQRDFVQFIQHISTGLLQQTASLVIYVGLHQP